MARLRTDPTLPPFEADALYAELVDAHRDLAPEASERLNARLILLLLNHIGDAQVVREALTMARESGTDAGGGRP